MKLQDRDLRIHMHGDDVKRLHEELQKLGFSIPETELSEGVFGQGTEQVVKEIQEKHGLQTSCIVDQETATRINREGQESAGPDTTNALVVKGRVVYADGQTLADGLVRAFDKDLRSEEFLGETTTDGEGRYSISYSAEQFCRAEQGSADLIVRAYNAEGRELAISPIVFNAQPEETIDLVVGGEVYRGPSEYEQLVEQLTPLLQGLSFAELTEDEEHQDISFLSGETGEDPSRIAFLIEAHRLAERTDIASEIFYGLIRNDLPPNLSALLIQDPDLIRRSLELAVADNLIPVRFAEGIDDLLARFRRLSVTEAVRPPGEGEQKPPLVTLLSTVLTDCDRQAEFIERYIDHSGPIEQFWEGLRKVPKLADQVDSIQFGLQAGALTGNHLPLVRELQRMREKEEDVGASTHRIQTFRDLVYVDEEKWEEIIKRDTNEGKIGVPDGTPGKDVDEQTRQYVRTLSRIVERSFPTAYVAARLEREERDDSDPLLGFLQRNVETFEIDGARLETYLAEHPEALEDISESDQPRLKQRLRAMQRVYRVAPRYKAMSALLKDGIDSAYAIVNMGREFFALRYGLHSPLDNKANAYHVYARAEQTHAMALAITSDHGMSGMRLPMKAVTDNRADSDAAIPDWQTLFGSLELCDCEHCRSVYSPAAYLVDLLHFLQGRKIINPSSIKRDKNGYINTWSFLTNDKTGNDLTAKDVLFSRRSGLGRIELTCTNTNTPLPYVDLVNEALEEFVAAPPEFSPFTLKAALAANLDKREVSKSLRDGFDAAPPLGYYLCDRATIEVVKKGEHWRLHDCAYSYDIRTDTSNLPEVRTRGRQTSGSKQELAANPQYLNPKAYDTLKERVFPFSLPFDLWDQEARTYLDHLGAKRHRLMEAFLPGTRKKRLDEPAIARAHLGLTTGEAKLISGDTEEQSGADAPGLWNLWGFEKAILEDTCAIPDPADSTAWLYKIKVPSQTDPKKTSSAWLDLLTGRVDVFLQQSGLKYKEMLDLLGTYFVNPLKVTGDRLITLIAQPSAPEDTCETKCLRLVGMDQDAALRALRFIRLWRKLGWRMQDLDRALTALGVNTSPHGAPQQKIKLGATGDTPIKDAVLTHLSHIQWLHEQLGVAVERLLPFWGTIDSATYIDHDAVGQTPFPTLYERLFRNKQVINPPDAAFTEDPEELTGALSKHTTTIAAALGLSATDLDRLIEYRLPQADVKLSWENLTTLYRHATLAEALGLSIRDYLIACELAFKPFVDTYPAKSDTNPAKPDTTKTVLFVQQIQTLAASDLTLVELDYLSRHRILESERPAPTETEIAQELTALRAELQRIAAVHRFEDDPSTPGGPTVDQDGELTRSKLSLLGWEDELIDKIVATLTDTAVWRIKLTPPSTTTAQNYAKEVTKLNVYEVSLANLLQNLIPKELKQVVTHANGKLKASRRLDLSERNTLRKAVKNNSSVKSAVEELIDQQKGHLTKIWYDQDSAALCFTGVMRKSRQDMLIDSSLAATNAAFRKAVEYLYTAPRTFFKRNLRSYKIEHFSTPLEKLPKKTGPGAKGTIEFPAAVRGKIVFDANKVCTIGKQGCLTFVSAMTEEELSMLRKLSTDTDYRNAIKALYAAPNKPATKDVFLEEDEVTKKDDVTKLFAESETPAERFEFLLKNKEKEKKKGLLEYLRDTLSRRVVVKSLAEALDLETQTAGDLLVKWLEWPVVTGTTASTPTKPLLDAFLDEQFAESSPRLKVTKENFKVQFAAYLLLHKSALVLSRFECTPRQARWLFTYESKAKWPDLSALPVKEATKPTGTLKAWLKLVELFEIRDGWSRGEEMLDDLLARAAAVTTGTTEKQEKASKLANKKAYLKALRKWTKWSDKDLDVLVGIDKNNSKLGQLKVAFPDHYYGAALLARLRDCFELLNRTGLSADNCVKLVADDVTPAAAQAAKEAARSKYNETQWLKIAPPLRDALRERQRAALVAYLLSKPNPKAEPGWRKVSDVYGYFLLDVEMSPCQLTSRIKQAISSVQLFIQRCLMGLEHYQKGQQKHQVLATAEIDNRWREWRWMKNYRVWEANRKIFLYPENWIEPELRDDKTPFFKALEGELLQTNLTKDTAETAFRGYLDKLDDVARLEAVGMYHERGKDLSGQISVDHLHVFGRRAGEPYQYYYRRRVKNRYWTTWERVDLDIEGEHLIPVVWLRRLYLIWPIFTEETETVSPTLTLGAVLDVTPRKRWKIQLAWSEYKDGKWLPKRISEATYLHEYLKSNIEKWRFFFKGVLSKSTFDKASELVVECYLSTGLGPITKTKNDPDYSSYYKSFKRLCKFVICGCGSDFVKQTSNPKGNINMLRPQGMDAKNMVLGECVNSQGKLYLPRTTSNDADSLALSLTPRGNFRLLYAHQCSNFSGMREKPWFFNDDLRTYFVVPKLRYAVMTWKKPDPYVNETLNAADLFYFSAVDDPFSAVISAEQPTPMVNPGDPLPFDQPITEPSAVKIPVAAYVSAGELGSASTGSLSVPTFGLTERGSDFASENTIPLTMVEDFPDDSSSFYPVSKVVKSKYDYSYRFHLFYHPYVCRFMEALNLNGVDGLLQRPLQLLSDLKLHPIKRNLFTWEYKPKTGVEALVDPEYPKEEVEFHRSGAYSQYNWELFFHAPLLIADSLRRNQRFADAQRWFHYIFDPTDSSGLPVPNRYWRTKPFYQTTTEKYQTEHITLLLRLMASGGDTGKLQGVDDSVKKTLTKTYKDLKDAVADWREDPFKPHLVARMRTTAYQKTVVMKYLDNLIEWGDQLFRRDTMESINEATQLYVLAADILGKRPDEIPPRSVPKVHTYESIEPLLGLFSNALVQIEELVPPSALSSGGGGGQQPLPSLPTTLYFCTPKNDELLAYWDKVADRLFKIRHCMNIEGVVRQLPLFAPPINPAMLVKAVAAGLDISSVLSEVNVPLPHYRFQILSQKATELCGELRSLGAALLSALEKRDAEKLALLRVEQEAALLKLTEQVRKKQVDEANQQIEVLKTSREIGTSRFEYYRDLLGEEGVEVSASPSTSDESAAIVGDLPSSSQASTQEEQGIRLIGHESSELESMKEAHSNEQTAADFDFIANFLHMIPSIEAKPLGIGAGFYFGHLLSSLSHSYRSLARERSYRASKSAKLANIVLRQHDWTLQANLAGKEITHIDQQIIAAHIRKEVAELELSNHKKQIEQANKVEKTLRDKYTNEQLYSWMVGQVSGVYFRSYQLAYDLAKRAERAFRHELGLSDSDYIQFGYWDSLKKGLLAGEGLTQDLKRMEVAYLDQNRRELEITKHVSLVQLDPVALIELRETGKCSFQVPDALFDIDYPGHYMRRIKTVSLTIPCVTGPYTGVASTLTLVRSSIRHSNLLSGGKYARDLENDDTRFTDSIGLAQSIVTSSGQNDSGLFETNLRDERFLPFEGAGAISTWQLELPSDFKPFDYDTITDVVLHLRYTARTAGGLLKQQAVSELKGAANAISKAGDEKGLARVFSLRHEFPSEWQSFVTLPKGTSKKQKQECSFDASKERFPYLFQGRTIKVVKAEAFVDFKAATDGSKITLALEALETGKTGQADPCASQSTSGAQGSQENNPVQDSKQDNGLWRAEWNTPPKQLGKWVLSACLNAEKAAALEDILIVCHYKIA